MTCSKMLSPLSLLLALRCHRSVSLCRSNRRFTSFAWNKSNSVVASKRQTRLLWVQHSFLSKTVKNTQQAKPYVPTLQMDTLNPNIKVLEWNLQGPLTVRAVEIERELKSGAKKPFTQVIRADKDDSHAEGQGPITFVRQTLALLNYPKLLDDPRFPADTKERAKQILKGCRAGSVGSYTDSPGIEVIRRQIAKHIEKRDGGIPSDWLNVILGTGVTESVKNVLKLLNCEVGGKKPGVMIPVPEYPLYSAALAEYNMHRIGYFLDESKNWEVSVSELQRAIDEAKKVCNPRALVVINPGNPTGKVLAKGNMKEIVKFARKEKLFLFADEVCQDSIYAGEFHSFKKVLTEMGKPYSGMELASFMSCSKGYLGECGLRGGYAEVINMNPQVKPMYLKLISAMLCPTVLGQATVCIMANLPQKGEPSYEEFLKEKTGVLESLKMRAKMVVDALNSIEGVSCSPVQGAVYAFPQIKLPPKAIKAAQKEKKSPDVFYAFELLENTGICIVPGSAFGQKPGTYHFRTTILLQPEKLKTMLDRLKAFHVEFIKKYS